MTKVLIVEDQRYPLEALEFAVRKAMPVFYIDFSKNDYEVARCYSEAEICVKNNLYDFVILDHRMPRENLGDLEERNMREFSSLLEEIGYSLIQVIKKKSPSTVIIGTSSLSKSELKGMLAPDFTISKNWDDEDKKLEKILKQVKSGLK